VDGLETGVPWPTFQLDGYGGWLWGLGEHAARHGRDVSACAEGAELTVRYVSAFWADGTYDWWEERLGRHTTTSASVYAGLAAASRLEFLPDDVRAAALCSAHQVRETVLAAARPHGRMGRELEDVEPDASLVACATPFRLLAPDEPLARATVEAVEDGLAHGGVHRYRGDSFYGGGEWLLLAALLGWYYAEAGRIGEARAQLEWVSAHATPAGDLAEQVDDHLLVPEASATWIERWGPPAVPLLWSHAMYVTLALTLGDEIALPQVESSGRNP
jgi:isomaltose glucohydrolase